MRPIETIHALAADVVSRDPGVGHYLRYGAILIAAILFIVVWMVHTWRNAPDPEERWSEARKESADPEDAERPR